MDIWNERKSAAGRPTGRPAFCSRFCGHRTALSTKEEVSPESPKVPCVRHTEGVVREKTDNNNARRKLCRQTNRLMQKPCWLPQCRRCGGSFLICFPQGFPCLREPARQGKAGCACGSACSLRGAERCGDDPRSRKLFYIFVWRIHMPAFRRGCSI